MKTARQIALTGAVSGSTNFDGSGNVSIITKQENIAVIMGNIDISWNNNSEQVLNGQKTINYPSGFNVDNTVVVSIGTEHSTHANQMGFGSITNEAVSINAGTIETALTLQEDKMILFARSDALDVGGTTTSNRTETYKYKIVLMKIPKPEVTILGDANCDGVVNSTDVTLIQNYVQGTSTLSLQGYINADVTKDGEVKSSDYLKVKDYVDGKISSLN